MGQNIDAAMQRGELTEEEAYFVLRFAGHHGYKEAMKRLKGGGRLHTIRRWLVWFGGWETNELTQWDRGRPKWDIWDRYRTDGKRRLTDVTPLSFCGHRLTFYSSNFGGWLSLRLRTCYLTVNYEWKRGQTYAYLSQDGTPPEKPGERYPHNPPREGRWLWRRFWKVGELESV